MSKFALRFALALAFTFSIISPQTLRAGELPGGARPLTESGDLALRMVVGLHTFLDALTSSTIERRASLWKYDFTSTKAYTDSVAPHRDRLRRILGADLPRVHCEGMEFASTEARESVVAVIDGARVREVRWPVLEGVEGSGLLIEPPGEARAFVIALPDILAAPEDLAGLNGPEGIARAGFAIRGLAASGCAILIPDLVGGGSEWSGDAEIGKTTDIPHREFIYRMAYEMGEHLIGFEILGIEAAGDGYWNSRHAPTSARYTGVIGAGESAALALYAGALDTRIDFVGLVGGFGALEDVPSQPIDRNVWRLRVEFGDAEAASLVAPRPLAMFEALPGAPLRAIAPGGRPAAPGRAIAPTKRVALDSFSRVKSIYAKLGAEAKLSFTERAAIDDGRDVSEFMNACRAGLSLNKTPFTPESRAPIESAGTASASAPATDSKPLGEARRKRGFTQLVEFVQKRVRLSHFERDKFWSSEAAALGKNPTAQEWDHVVEAKRKYFHEEVIGKLPDPVMPPNPRMRVAYDTPKYIGYETMLDVWPGVFAYGALLVPKDLKPGERRPVVVCQHGLEGRPKDVIEPGGPYYEEFAARLASEGFITFAPQNPYIFGDKFRSLQRKANPLGLSLFSFIVGQHQQILNWLTTLPFVDPSRIAFYGLSYGGKTAMRVPAIETRYCLSICSGDFNDWITKNAMVESPYSYMFTGEYEMPEFDLGRTFNYAEMARLIAPRPFMVERGHFDGVAPDEWVAGEFAKVRQLYDRLGVGDRAEIEFFNGPHKINGVGTYAFLRKWLRWPER